MRFVQLIWANTLGAKVEVNSSGWSNSAAQMNLDTQFEEKEDPVTLVSGFIYVENIVQ